MRRAAGSLLQLTVESGDARRDEAGLERVLDALDKRERDIAQQGNGPRAHASIPRRSHSVTRAWAMSESQSMVGGASGDGDGEKDWIGGEAGSDHEVSGPMAACGRDHAAVSIG